jgi:hypothetical protein
MDLKQISTFAREAWTFEEKEYPLLARLTLQADRQAFIMRHVLSHIIKTVGQMASTFESLDHGKDLNRDQLCAALRQLILEAVQCADVVGITPTELEHEIRRWRAANEQKAAA